MSIGCVMVGLYSLPSPAVTSKPAATLLKNHAFAGMPEITIVVLPAMPRVFVTGDPLVGAAGVTQVTATSPGAGGAHEKY